MAYHIGVQMDPVEKIDIAGDSTFALMLEAQKRNHKLFYYKPDQLFMLGDQLSAKGYDLKVEDKVNAHFEASE